MFKELQILVLDDHPTFSDALAARLGTEPGMAAIAATSVEKARRVLRQRPIDVVLLDIDLDGWDGICFARELAEEHPGVRIVIVTAGAAVSRVTEVVRIGVSGWLSKDSGVERLLAVIRGAVRGETSIPPQLLTTVLHDLRRAERERNQYESLVDTLTPREREILTCMVAGNSRAAIAEKLVLSPNTVRTHVQNVLTKLGVHSMVAAVAAARRAGLGDIPSSSTRGMDS